MSEPSYRVDHLVVACPDLEEGVALLEDLLGVRASPGGRHEGRGTHNALIGLGPDAYLEVVSLDPTQERPAGPRWFGLDRPMEPTLVTWCVKAPGDRLDRLARRAERIGVPLGQVVEGSRRTPDGRELRWRFTDPLADRLGGVVPFFIEWSSPAHPAQELEPGCTLELVRVEHPDPERVRAVLEELEVGPEVVSGEEPRLVARIRCPRGVVELGRLARGGLLA